MLYPLYVDFVPAGEPRHDAHRRRDSARAHLPLGVAVSLDFDTPPHELAASLTALQLLRSNSCAPTFALMTKRKPDHRISSPLLPTHVRVHFVLDTLYPVLQVSRPSCPGDTSYLVLVMYSYLEFYLYLYCIPQVS